VIADATVGFQGTADALPKKEQIKEVGRRLQKRGGPDIPELLLKSCVGRSQMEKYTKGTRTTDDLKTLLRCLGDTAA